MEGSTDVKVCHSKLCHLIFIDDKNNEENYSSTKLTPFMSRATFKHLNE